MNRRVIEMHSEFGGPGKVLLTVAVESDYNKYEAYQRTCSDVSNFDITITLSQGKKLSEAAANFIFPSLVKEHGYTYDNTEVVGSTSVDELESLSGYYEGIKDDLNSMILAPQDREARANALQKLVKMRDLAAPHMVKQFNP